MLNINVFYNLGLFWTSTCGTSQFTQLNNGFLWHACEEGEALLGAGVSHQWHDSCGCTIGGFNKLFLQSWRETSIANEVAWGAAAVYTLCFYHVVGKWWSKAWPCHPTCRESPQPCVCSPAGCSSVELPSSTPPATISAKEKSLGAIGLKKI